MILSDSQIEGLQYRFDGWFALGGLAMVKSKLPRFGKEKRFQLECMITAKADKLIRIDTDKVETVKGFPERKAPYEIKPRLSDAKDE